MNLRDGVLAPPPDDATLTEESRPLPLADPAEVQES